MLMQLEHILLLDLKLNNGKYFKLFKICYRSQQKGARLDYLFVGVGAGGLASGVGTYLKYMKEMDIKIIGV